MSWSLIAHTAANAQTTSAINTTGADLIVISLGGNIGSSAAPTDNKGNTWTALTYHSAVANYGARLFYCESPTVGAGHTFSGPTASSFIPICVQAWSGSAASSPFDQQNGNDYHGSNVTTLAAGSITPGQNNELVVTAISTLGGAVSAVDTGFTISDTTTYSGGYSGGMAYLEQSTAGAVNPNWTFASYGYAIDTVIASFKGAGSGTNVTLTAATSSGSVEPFAIKASVGFGSVHGAASVVGPTSKLNIALGTVTTIAGHGTLTPQQGPALAYARALGAAAAFAHPAIAVALGAVAALGRAASFIFSGNIPAFFLHARRRGVSGRGRGAPGFGGPQQGTG